MTVLLPNALLAVRVRAHPERRDARGTPVADAEIETRGPLPGAAIEQQDLSYHLRLDPSLWPVRAEDTVVDENGRVFVLTGNPRLIAVPGAPDVDHITCNAVLDPPKVP